MGDCGDYWCENYAKNSAKCDFCKNKDNVIERSDLITMMKEHSIDITEQDKSKNKSHQQAR